MKKIVITTMIATAMLVAGATNAYAAGNPLDGYYVTVYDRTTPSTFAAGKDWPITTWYFYGKDGQVLGSISGSDAMSIMQMDSSSDTTWEIWFADAFNKYRDNATTMQTKDKNTFESESSTLKEKHFAPTTPSLARPQDDFDAKNIAMEVIKLTNAERKNHGLHPLEVDEGLMELAQTRAKEVSSKYSHERPDGTTVVELGCGENVGAKTSAEKQVTSWMNSDGHRRNILLKRYKTIGVGCYKADNGRTYWVQIFKP